MQQAAAMLAKAFMEPGVPAGIPLPNSCGVRPAANCEMVDSAQNGGRRPMLRWRNEEKRMTLNRFAGAALIAALALTACSGKIGGSAAGVLPEQHDAQLQLQGQFSGSYRHGLLPMLGRREPLQAISSYDVRFRGGIDGVGVTTGTPKIYLVFWGNQWGKKGKNGQGYTTFSNDPDNLAPYVQAFFAGLGTGNEALERGDDAILPGCKGRRHVLFLQRYARRLSGGRCPRGRLGRRVGSGTAESHCASARTRSLKTPRRISAIPRSGPTAACNTT